KSYRQIAKLVRCDPKTVGNMLNRLENPSQILPNRRGRPPILNELAQDHLSQLVLSNHCITKRQIQAALEQQEGRIISQRTISCTLRKANLVSCVACNVLWSDKKYFTLVHSNPYQHVWRRPYEEFNDDCLVLAIKSKGIMMCGCFSWWGLSPFICLY
ncbi:746_t:CDS:2, partial [Dentiscutata heterogama]